MTEPKQAIEEYLGEQFIEWLNNFVVSEIESWPIVAKIKQSHSKPEKIKKILLQVFLVEQAFLGSREGDPGFLGFAIANLSESDDPQAETALEILQQRRNADNIQNRQLWARLLQALGTVEEEMTRAEPKEPTRNYIAELSDIYSTSEWQTAAGAFASQERTLVVLGKILLEFLKNNAQLSDKDLEVLTNRSIANGNGTHHLLEKIVFDPESKELVWQGVERQLTASQEFLQGLEKYLEN